MHNDEICFCRVCGLRFDDPPWGLDGQSPSFDICPCCGVEFGYEDCNHAAIRGYRDEWIRDGMNWNYKKSRPEFWDVTAQMACIPERFR